MRFLLSYLLPTLLSTLPTGCILLADEPDFSGDSSQYVYGEQDFQGSCSFTKNWTVTPGKVRSMHVSEGLLYSQEDDTITVIDTNNPQKGRIADTYSGFDWGGINCFSVHDNLVYAIGDDSGWEYDSAVHILQWNDESNSLTLLGEQLFEGTAYSSVYTSDHLFISTRANDYDDPGSLIVYEGYKTLAHRKTIDANGMYSNMLAHDGYLYGSFRRDNYAETPELHVRSLDSPSTPERIWAKEMDTRITDMAIDSGHLFTTHWHDYETPESIVFIVWSLDDPAAPVELASLRTDEFSTIHSSVDAIAINAARAYLVTGGNHEVIVLDISDPSNPIPIGLGPDDADQSIHDLVVDPYADSPIFYLSSYDTISGYEIECSLDDPQ